jgi:hypothetical protein
MRILARFPFTRNLSFLRPLFTTFAPNPPGPVACGAASWYENDASIDAFNSTVCTPLGEQLTMRRGLLLVSLLLPRGVGGLSTGGRNGEGACRSHRGTSWIDRQTHDKGRGGIVGGSGSGRPMRRAWDCQKMEHQYRFTDLDLWVGQSMDYTTMI